MCIEDMDLEDMAKVIISEADQKKSLQMKSSARD